MSLAVSPSANKPYGLARVCRMWGIPRSSVYYHKRRQVMPPPVRRKPGPKSKWSDQDLEMLIRQDLEHSPWQGEGHRKVWARLRRQNVCVGRPRILRVMRENSLLAPQRQGCPHGNKAHDGTIIPDRPDCLWGTDATGTLTGEGMATVFFVIDHYTAECLGIHAARRGTRWEALEPLWQAVNGVFGKVEADVGKGLALRHDHGSQFISHAYQDTLRTIGIVSSPSYVKEPEGNGCAERFVRTLKEQLLWLDRFDTVEELRSALQGFMTLYNNHWLIQRHGYIPPSEARRKALACEVEAA